MNPFPDSPTGSKPLWLRRFAARPALVAFLLCLVLGLAAVVWRAKEGADAAHAHARSAAQARGAAVELQFSQAVSAAEVLGVCGGEGNKKLWHWGGEVQRVTFVPEACLGRRRGESKS